MNKRPEQKESESQKKKTFMLQSMKLLMWSIDFQSAAHVIYGNVSWFSAAASKAASPNGWFFFCNLVHSSKSFLPDFLPFFH